MQNVTASNVKLIDTFTDACSRRRRTNAATQRVRTCTGNIDGPSSSSNSVTAPGDRPALFTVPAHLPAALHRTSLSKNLYSRPKTTDRIGFVRVPWYCDV